MQLSGAKISFCITVDSFVTLLSSSVCTIILYCLHMFLIPALLSLKTRLTEINLICTHYITLPFPEAFSGLKEMALKAGFSLSGSIMSLDGVYDSKANRKKIFNHNMTPNIPENKRNRKRTKRGRKRKFDKGIFRKRFETIERCFAWEDKFKRLLVRFERISGLHLSLKLIAFTMINLRRHI